MKIRMEHFLPPTQISKEEEEKRNLMYEELGNRLDANDKIESDPDSYIYEDEEEEINPLEAKNTIEDDDLDFDFD